MMNTVGTIRHWGRRFGIGLFLLHSRQKLQWLAFHYSPLSITRRLRLGNRFWNMAMEAIAQGALHKNYELAAMFSHVHQLKPRSILEIGVASGSTFQRWIELADPEATIVGVDLQIAPQLKQHPQLGNGQQKIKLIEGDSHAAEIHALVQAEFPDGIDFIFIDGDHSYAGAKQDYEVYRQWLKPGGVIMLHDINPDWREKYNRDCVEDSGQVYKLWHEIKQQVKTQELIERPEQSGYGIGIAYF